MKALLVIISFIISVLISLLFYFSFIGIIFGMLTTMLIVLVFFVNKSHKLILFINSYIIYPKKTLLIFMLLSMIFSIASENMYITNSIGFFATNFLRTVISFYPLFGSMFVILKFERWLNTRLDENIKTAIASLASIIILYYWIPQFSESWIVK